MNGELFYEKIERLRESGIISESEEVEEPMNETEKVVSIIAKHIMNVRKNCRNL